VAQHKYAQSAFTTNRRATELSCDVYVVGYVADGVVPSVGRGLGVSADARGGVEWAAGGVC
jgi:hypothetical protein